MIKGLEGMTYEERLRELNVYSLKKHKQVKEDLIIYKYFKAKRWGII